VLRGGRTPILSARQAVIVDGGVPSG